MKLALDYINTDGTVTIIMKLSFFRFILWKYSKNYKFSKSILHTDRLERMLEITDIFINFFDKYINVK